MTSLGASTQLVPHPLPQLVMNSSTTTSPIASRFQTMPINTVQEVDTQEASGVQGASVALSDADVGEEGQAETWDLEQAEFLEGLASMPEEYLKAQARSGAEWDFTMNTATMAAEFEAQQRNLKLSDIQVPSPDSGSFAVTSTGETGVQFPGSGSFTAASR
jgi:hypothetical protein